MSTLRRSNGEDYPAAAAKHLDDAELLLREGRFDAAAYLVGYVIECSLSTVIMVGELEKLGEIKPERLWPRPKGDLHSESPTFKRFTNPVGAAVRKASSGHLLDNVADSVAEYAKIPNAVSAQYIPAIDKKRPPFGGAWHVNIRYRAAGSVDEKDARAWFEEARRIYLSTVGRMERERRIHL